MTRFKVGDRARIVVTTEAWRHVLNKECTIREINPEYFPEVDYTIIIDGIVGVNFAMDGSLEPIIDAELGSWEALAALGWDPRNVKEQA